MNLNERIDLLVKLGDYLGSDSETLQQATQKAFEKNGWFTHEFTGMAIKNICEEFLERDKLTQWVKHYHLDDNVTPKNVGVVMAGNIPLVGFHDFLTVFITGHQQTIKLSSKDEVLFKHIADTLFEWQPALHDQLMFADVLKDCDAYIATGGNNSARYFDYYFGRYPSVIRRQRTSVAVLSGNETAEQLGRLADDVHLYFGLGCRNVTKTYVPEKYDFVPLLEAFKKYNYFADHTKYKNNYDYNLTLLIMNSEFYMTNESILLTEREELFSPISQLNYSFYNDPDLLRQRLKDNDAIQCITGDGNMEFGKTQHPSLFSYADGIDTMQFLLSL